MKTDITRTEVIDFIASLGLDRLVVERDVCEVVITPDCVTVTLWRRDTEGHLFVIGDEVAATTTQIAIR